MTVAVGAQVYTQGFGSRPENIEIPIYSPAAPGAQMTKYPLGKRCITPGGEYVLTSFTSTAGVLAAVWTLLGGDGSPFNIEAAGLTVPMVSGSVTVTDPNITTSSIIIYSAQIASPNAGVWSINSQSNGSFQIGSTNTTETSTFYYLVVN